jgi:hypothetical protein
MPFSPTTGPVAPTSPAALFLWAAAVGSGPATVSLILLICLATPVLAATVVLTWHGLRGTQPGPAAGQLLLLIEILTRRRRR